MKHTIILEVEADDQDAVPGRGEEEARDAAVQAARLAVMSGRGATPTTILTVKAAYAETDEPSGAEVIGQEVAASSGPGVLNTGEPDLAEGKTRDGEDAAPGRVESVSGAKMPDTAERQDFKHMPPETVKTPDGGERAATQPYAVTGGGEVKYGEDAASLYVQQGGQYGQNTATDEDATETGGITGGQPFSTAGANEEARDTSGGSD